MITVTQWMSLKPETRQKLRELLKIKRSAPTWVRDQTLISDGVTQEDLNNILGEDLADFVGGGGTIDVLFLKAVDLIEHNVVITEPEPPVTPEIAPVNDLNNKTDEDIAPLMKCEVCGKEYSNLKRYKTHLKKHK